MAISGVVEGLLGHQAVLVAHDLGLFTALAAGPLTTTGLCAALGLARRAGEGLLAVCASLGLLSRDGEGLELTPLGADYMAPGGRAYVGGLLDLIIRNRELFTFDSVRRAVVENRQLANGGRTIFDSYEENPALARGFTEAMHGHTMAPAMAWPRHADLGGCDVLLDIGGGSGVHAMSAVTQWPGLRAIVLDLPAVCDIAAGYIVQRRLGDRVSTHAADMWTDAFPVAAAHFYSDILHDWPPERGRELLRKSFDALPPGGRIMLHEMLLDDDHDGPFAVAASSLSMLLWCGGQQYTGPELTAMLAESGFRDTRVIPTFGYWSLVAGVKR
jgi:acetylserotonin N-methyltransferase